jgi:hypothetical protein
MKCSPEETNQICHDLLFNKICQTAYLIFSQMAIKGYLMITPCKMSKYLRGQKALSVTHLMAENDITDRVEKYLHM